MTTTKQKRIVIHNPICCQPHGVALKRNIYYFRIPDGSLSRIFKDFDNNRDRYNAAKVLSLVQLTQAHENEHLGNGFVSIPRRTFEKACGKGYRKYLDYLIYKALLIEPFISADGKESYFHGNSSTVKPFCKKYKFTKRFTFQTVIWTQNDLVPTGLVDDSMVFTPNGKYDAELLHCLNFERKLSLDKSGLDEIDENLVGYYSDQMQRFNHGNFVPSKQDKSTRFYFNSVMLDNRLKKYLRYEGKNKLVNFDVKCCYPSFLKQLTGLGGYVVDNKCIPNLNQNKIKINRKELRHEIPQFRPLPPSHNGNTDFYSMIGDGLGLSRDAIKKEFNSFVNSKMKAKQRHPFFHRLHQVGFGKMADYIVATDNLWKVLEDFESELISKLIRKCIDVSVPINRSHDGFLCLDRDVSKIEGFLDEVLKDYPHIQFEQKPLDQMEGKKDVSLVDLNNLASINGEGRIDGIKDSLNILQKTKWTLKNEGKDVSKFDDAIRYMDKLLACEYEHLNQMEDSAAAFDEIFGKR